VENGDRVQLGRVLRRIPSAAWDGFLGSAEGRHPRLRLQALEETLAGTSQGAEFSRAATSTRVSRLLGYGVMQDAHCGAWVREQLLRGASRSAWVRVLDAYASLNSRKTVEVRRNASTPTRAHTTSMRSSWVVLSAALRRSTDPLHHGVVRVRRPDAR